MIVATKKLYFWWEVGKCFRSYTLLRGGKSQFLLWFRRGCPYIIHTVHIYIYLKKQKSTFFSVHEKVQIFILYRSESISDRDSISKKMESTFLFHAFSDLSEWGLRWRQLSPWSTAPGSLSNVGQIAWVAGNDAVIVEEIGNQFLPSLNITPFFSRARAQMHLCWLRQLQQRYHCVPK